MNTKKAKNKIIKLIEKSDSENDQNEHELNFYVNDRVKLMKEVLKIIKPKKIKSMAPDCIKDLDMEEINSMLLEELLGISNKRLKYIFSGQNLDEDSSSTDPEEEKQPIDIISLDDVSEDDFIIDVDADKSRKKKHTNVKEESKMKKIKKEKRSTQEKEGSLQEENLMSVLELLELQARARAIRSQLSLEANKKTLQVEIRVNEESDPDDAVIIEVPKNEEIVIDSSDSETERQKRNGTGRKKLEIESKTGMLEPEIQPKKITLVRDRFDKQDACNSPENKETDVTPTTSIEKQIQKTDDNIVKNQNQEQSKKLLDTNRNCGGSNENIECNLLNSPLPECPNDEDEIILIVDQEEMDGIMCD